MFSFRSSSRRSTSTTRRPGRKGPRLGVEALEARDLMANYLLLDFSPDAIQGERYQAGPFVESFTLRYDNGYAPAFLDMDADGYITENDVDVASVAIANRTAAYLQGFDVGVWYGDVWSDTGVGLQWLNWGLQNPSEQVFVMYVGGWSFFPGALGVGYQPREGYNHEYYAFTFATETTAFFMVNQPWITPWQYVEEMARIVVHEFGHLVGLGHVYNNPPGDVNIMNYRANPATAQIPNSWYPQIELWNQSGQQYWGWQNPAQELYASLQGQPDDWQRRGPYSRFEGGGHWRVTVEEVREDLERLRTPEQGGAGHRHGHHHRRGGHHHGGADHHHAGADHHHDVPTVERRLPQSPVDVLAAVVAANGSPARSWWPAADDAPLTGGAPTNTTPGGENSAAVLARDSRTAADAGPRPAASRGSLNKTTSPLEELFAAL